MKKLLFTSGLLIFAGTFAVLTVYRIVDTQNPTPGPEHPTVLGQPSDQASPGPVKFKYKDLNLEALFFLVKNTDRLVLFSNLESKLSAADAYEDNDCGSLISAAFYTQENTHVGLFVSEYKRLQNEKNSLLFDGFFTVNDFEIPKITRDVPTENVRVAVQSGPLLIENASDLSLSIKNDKNARRVIVATTGENEVYFIAVYDTNSKFSGPMLQDLPDVLVLLREKTGLPFADALNLDGGTASAFYTQDLHLTEASPIGSYFCVR